MQNRINLQQREHKADAACTSRLYLHAQAGLATKFNTLAGRKVKANAP